jgi:nucleoside-diphosphate-sugar epimerase
VWNDRSGGGEWIVGIDDQVLVTGANGFIGAHVVEALLRRGFCRVRCLVRSRAHKTERLLSVLERFPSARVEIMEGNLKSAADCAKVVVDARIVLHLAAGVEKSFPGSFLNTVVTTRNLLDAVIRERHLLRFVNVSSFSVYTNVSLRRRGLLDETCALETEHVARNEPYSFAKIKQEEIVRQYAKQHALPYVVVRPGAVYGPGKADITGRVGIDTFGIFLHLGGGNRIPFTHVRNCAEAIVLAGLTAGIDGETFNVVDDDLPTSRQFMRAYRRYVGRLPHLTVPYPVFYAFSYLWEKYSAWSEGQLPPAFNRRRCAAYWKGNQYTNRKAKALTGWKPTVSFADGSREYFAYVKARKAAAC